MAVTTPARTAFNTALLIAVRTARQAFVLAAVIVTQRALHADRYGQFATIVVLSNIASVANDVGIIVVFTREAARHRDRLGHYLGVGLASKLPLAVAGGAALLLLVWLLTPSLLPLAGPAYALLVVTSLANLLRAPFYVTGEMGFEAVAIMVETAILIGLTVVFALTHQGVAAYLWAYTASYGFTVIYAGVITHRRYARLRLLWDTSQLWAFLRSGAPFALGFLLTTVYFKIDVVILQALRGFTQVGYYNAAYKYIEGLSFVPQAAMSALYPALSVAWHRGGAPAMRGLYTRAYRLLAALGMPATVGCILLATPIVRYTGALGPAAPSLRILGGSLFFIFVVNSFVYALGAMDRQLTFAVLTGSSIAVNVVLNLVMISLFPRGDGYLASSWATVITEAVLFAAGCAVMRRRLGRLPWVDPTVRVAVAGAAMAAVMLPLGSLPVVAAPLGATVYVLVLVASGGVRRDEVEMVVGFLRRRRAGVPVGTATDP